MLIVLFGAVYDALPLAPLVVGLIWTLRYQKVADLSLAGSFSIAAGLAAHLLNSGQGIFLSIALGILVGISIGLFMGLTVNILRIDPLMSGLIVLFIAYAISLGITQGTVSIPDSSNPFEPLLLLERQSGMPFWLHPFLNLVFLCVCGLAIWGSQALLNSEWGCAFRALESEKSGRTFLHSMGIQSERISILGFVIAAFWASISGIMVALRDGQATSSLGLDSMIEIIPAYLLGLSLFERRASLKDKNDDKNRFSFVSKIISNFRMASPTLAAVIGVLVFFLIVNAAQRWTGATWLPRVVVGVSLLVALGFGPAWRNREIASRQRKSTKLKRETESLEVKGLTATYATISGPLNVLNNINLKASPGDILLLKGANGSGKTTLLRALSSLIDCQGSFQLPVNSGNGDKADWRGRASLVGFVPQHANSATSETLSIAEHAAIAWCGKNPSMFRPWKDAASLSVPLLNISDVTTNSETLLKWLSGGQVRRVLLGLLNARKDSEKPVVVVLDEPFSHLDIAGQEVCVKQISSLAEGGSIVLLVDHGEHIEENVCVLSLPITLEG